MKKLAVLFSGIRYSPECPLLYFAGKECKQAGYDVLPLFYSFRQDAELDKTIDLQQFAEETKAYVEEELSKVLDSKVLDSKVSNSKGLSSKIFVDSTLEKEELEEEKLEKEKLEKEELEKEKSYKKLDKKSYEELCEESYNELYEEPYEEIIFISKSIGTVLAGYAEQKFKIKPKQFFITPLSEALEYMKDMESERVIAILGTEDANLSAKELQQFCETYHIPLTLYSGVGHRLEKEDLKSTLNILEDIMKQLRKFLS